MICACVFAANATQTEPLNANIRSTKGARHNDIGTVAPVYLKATLDEANAQSDGSHYVLALPSRVSSAFCESLSSPSG